MGCYLTDIKSNGGPSSLVTTTGSRPSADPHSLAHRPKLSKTARALLGAEILDGNIPLMKRVKWFEHPDRPNRNPKENSAWFWWARNAGRALHPPSILYAPNHDGGR